MSSNLYADSIFADHPTAIWTLDEDLGYPTLDSKYSSQITNLRSTYKINYNLSGFPLQSYGNLSSNGYYITAGGQPYARNGGVPFIYGSSSTTTLGANTSPSILIPGFGFLNKDGIAKSITLETWIRISDSQSLIRRIIGPITGYDGLYVSGPFLVLRIGNNIGSHYVGEWGRQMLLHIYYTPNSAGVMVNGEQVISLSFDSKTLGLPKKYTGLYDNDWIQFSGDGIDTIQLDCISLYPYLMTSQKAKLHYVKGLSVESPQLKNSSYSDTPIIMDYQMSKYANNYSYPGIGKWEQGAIDNLAVSQNRLTVPSYKLPEVKFETQSISDSWLALQSRLSGQQTTDSTVMASTSSFYTINPMSSILGSNTWGHNGYLYFDNFSMIDKRVEAFYGIFIAPSLDSSGASQYLFKIENNINQLFEVTLKNDKVVYKFISNGNVKINVESSTSVVANNRFAAGISIDAFVSKHNDPELVGFFANRASLKTYIGGSKDFTNSFTGKIYRIAFSNKNNLAKISASFSDGIASYSADLNSNYATYTLISTIKYKVYGLDIAISGSWEDYVPLSMLAKNVVADSSGNTEYRLDFIQHNIDYPETSLTSNMFVRSYVEFKDIGISEISNEQTTKTYAAIPENHYLAPGDDWQNKRYEIVNNTVIGMPTNGYDTIADLGLATHIDFTIPGILRNNVSIRLLHLAGQALNYGGMKTPIGTRLSKDIYSYGTDSNVKTYRPSQLNPYTIYKNSTPYMYLSRYTGIRLMGTVFDGTRGIEIPVNEYVQDFYRVSYIQAAFITEDAITTARDGEEVMRITDSKATYIVKISKVGTADPTFKVFKNNVDVSSAVNIFIDGKQGRTFYADQWHMLGIQFKTLLDFNSFSDGSIKITGKFLFNNITDYTVPEDLARDAQTYDLWSKYTIGIPDTTENQWNDISGTADTVDGTAWTDIYVDEVVQVGLVLDVPQIYNTYYGNNKIVSNETVGRFSVYPNEYIIYLGSRWQNYTITPL